MSHVYNFSFVALVDWFLQISVSFQKCRLNHGVSISSHLKCYFEIVSKTKLLAVVIHHHVIMQLGF